MAKILIAYFSVTNNTKSMADLIAQGTRETGADTIVKPIESVSVDELLEYDGIIIGSPTYYGGPAYQVRKLIDESVRIHGKLAGKVGGAFSSSANIGGGNETTVVNILNALMVHGMVVIGSSAGDHYGPVSIGSVDKRSKEMCKEYGYKVATLTKKLFS